MLLGRQSELERIDELIARVTSGFGAVALVEGPAGIGKTVLLAEAARRVAGSGFLVLRAAGGQLEREYGFGVVRHMFAPVVAPGRGSADLLEGAAELAAVPLGLVPAMAHAAGDWGDRAAAAMHGLYWLIAKLAERAPLLLALDDAHWADAMSLRFVLYLARRLEDVRLLLLVAAEPAAEHGEGGLLAQLGVLPGLVVLRPAPLTEPQVERLIGQRVVREPDDEFVVACHHASGGNPLLLGELVSRLRADGASGSAADAARVAGIAPQGIVRWVATRLLALGRSAERLASAYAVLGAGAALCDAAVLAGLDSSAAAAAADALIGACILTAERPHEFVHPLVRAAVYDGLPPAKRADAHARAARLTAERGAPLALVAAHLLAAGPERDRWAVEVLRAAAREACASGAPGSAASYLERALREIPPRELREELLLELGEAQLNAGLAGATQRMREALDLDGDPTRRAEICLTLGRALFSTGDYAAARESFRRGLSELPDGNDDLFLELWAPYTADTRHDPQLPAAAQARLRALLADDSPGRTRTERLLLAHLAFQSARSGERPRDQVARLARRALADGELLHDSGRDIGPYVAACHALVSAGEPGSAIAELNRAIDSSQRRGSRVAFGGFSHLRGIARYLCGELIDAIADLEDASNAYKQGDGHVLPDTRAFLTLCLIERDDLAGAAEALALPGEDEQWLAKQPASVSYLYALGRLRAARGHLREGLNALLECEQWVREMKAPNPAANLPWRSDAALLAARLGEQDRARELLADTISLARAFGAPHALGIALRAAGLIEDANTGLERLAEAVAVLDGSGINLQLARTLTDQGAALRRAGHRREALEPLRRGLDLTTRCGALAVSTRAREELVAAGARPRRERIRGADALTASELRVARMAANGMTNTQIAQGLFVTRRTVETHLTSIYRKLDIRRRDHLAEALGREPSHT